MSAERSVPAGILFGLVVLLGLAIMASLVVGAGEIGPVPSFQALLGLGNEEARFVVWDLRLPRTLVGLVVEDEHSPPHKKTNQKLTTNLILG